MGSVDYSEPPKTMCFLSRSSSYDELVTKVHSAMDTNADKTRLVLFGRHPMIIRVAGGQIVFIPVPLTDDQSWKWFMQVASQSQPIHVYARITERRTDGESRGQEVPLLNRRGTYPWDYGDDDYSSERVACLCSKLFNTSVMEPAFPEMFADIFNRLSCMLPEFRVNDEKLTLKMSLLLDFSQQEFERSGEADREFALSSSDDQKKMIHMRRRKKLGNIKLIGELYKKKMVREGVMHKCIKKLLGVKVFPDEEDTEALCHLML